MARATAVAAEIAVEQRHVDRVIERLDAAEAAAGELEREGYGRGHIEHEGGVKEEHQRGLFERDVLVYAAARRVSTLNAQREGVVFGRLDHRDGRVRYVGRLGIRDADHEPLLIDWRAPAAEPFYRATGAEPDGVVRRRVLRCVGPEVVGVEDDLLDPVAAPDDLVVVGDGALIAALSRARGRRMHDIVATIQREQDEAIRAPADGTVMITGGPGTGKTVVALHRAAYLLYRHRRRFERTGVLVVGPSPTFMGYIERVLPSLGEQDATLLSIGEVLDGVAATRRDRPPVAAVKGSARMLPVLRRAVHDAMGDPPALRLYFRDRVLALDAGRTGDIRARAWDGDAPAAQARVDAIRAVLAELYRQAMVDTAHRMARVDFDDEILDRGEFVGFVRDWWPRLSPHAVWRHLAGPGVLGRCAAGVLTGAEIADLSGHWPADPDAGVAVDDVPLLDELRAMLVRRPRRGDDAPAGLPSEDGRNGSTGPRRPDHYDEYGHVLVDEAQDLSPMQWRMLARRGRHASWTVVGDLAQSSWPDLAEVRAAMLGTVPTPHRTFRLATNYRNSAEIFDLASRLIRSEMPDAEIPVAVRTTGRAPRHRVVAPGALADAVTDAAGALLADVEGTVAVIGTADRIDALRDRLARLEPDGSGAVEERRLVVLSGLDSKGMEYDGVVVVEPAELIAESATGLRTVYVALTRATVALTTVGSDGRWLDRVAAAGTGAAGRP